MPVLPVAPYGVTGFTAYPGSPTLRASTLLAVLSDVVDSLLGQGFARVLVVNGHGGNTEPGGDWARGRVRGSVVWHELWEGRPDEIAAAIDPDYEHASWSENFPWTRLPGVVIPEQRKPPVEWPENGNPETWREALGDGSFGGLYQRSSEDESRLWEAAVQAIRERLETVGTNRGAAGHRSKVFATLNEYFGHQYATHEGSAPRLRRDRPGCL